MLSWGRKVDDAMLTFAALREAEQGVDFSLRIRTRVQWFEAKEQADAFNAQLVVFIEDCISEGNKLRRPDMG